MTTYKLIFAPEFVKDLDETFSYISQMLTAQDAAVRLMKKIDDSIMKLKTFPEMYPLCDEPLDALGYRKIIVNNYVMIYFVDYEKKNVNMLRCFYGKRDYLKYFI